MTGPADATGTIRVFLCGDVMLGRGIDQILPHPGDPHLHEGYTDSALEYVALAEAANGPIARPVDFAYVWGDARQVFARLRPDIRIVNLETAVTRSKEFVPKGINYRMSPENIPVLAAAGIDCCVLANNHILDWGQTGLLDTVAAVGGAAIATAGAGANSAQASAPAILPVAPTGRVLVFALGAPSSGIPPSWAARPDKPGVNLLADLSARTAAAIGAQVDAVKQPGDIAVASIHWGGNWGYAIGAEQRHFAQALIERAGIDIVHGHSSHHAKGIEVHQGRLILYGCGDFLNDYEGIRGYEKYRDDLTLAYFADIDGATGALAGLTMVPLQIRNFRLNSATHKDAQWLRHILDRESNALGAAVELAADDTLRLVWQ